MHDLKQGDGLGAADERFRTFDSSNLALGANFGAVRNQACRDVKFCRELAIWS